MQTPNTPHACLLQVFLTALDRARRMSGSSSKAVPKAVAHSMDITASSLQALEERLLGVFTTCPAPRDVTSQNAKQHQEQTKQSSQPPTTALQVSSPSKHQPKKDAPQASRDQNCTVDAADLDEDGIR